MCIYVVGEDLATNKLTFFSCDVADYGVYFNVGLSFEVYFFVMSDGPC